MRRLTGITGGIGSGKSTVCRLFAMYGRPVYDCDARARELMNSEPELVSAIKELLGGEAYRDGKLDRRYVAARVFGSRPVLAQLEALVHPAVTEDLMRWASQKEGYLVIESAILFESGLDRHMDDTVAVIAPQEVRIARVMEREGCERQKVLDRMASQMDQQQMAARSKYTIVNDGERSLVEQVAALHEIFRDGC